MPSLKSLKMRITSVKSTQKITKAMKMVAAAKLRRAQEAAEAARPYSVRMAAVMASLEAGGAVLPLNLCTGVPTSFSELAAMAMAPNATSSASTVA